MLTVCIYNDFPLIYMNKIKGRDAKEKGESETKANFHPNRQILILAHQKICIGITGRSAFLATEKDLKQAESGVWYKQHELQIFYSCKTNGFWRAPRNICGIIFWQITLQGEK